MRNSDSKTQRLKSFFSLFIPHSLKYFSLSQQLLLVLLAFFILGLLYFRFYHHSSHPLRQTAGDEIVVEVTGEVRNPGILFFQDLPTLKEAVEKAGGLTERAQFDPGSSSERLKTGTLVNVRKKAGSIVIKLERMEAHRLLVFSVPLDLNRVSVEDLCLVPGIGESLASEIVAHRESRKGFLSVQELKSVKGIGEKKWLELKDFFVVPSSAP
jgi:competence protein ComEA